ncbi:unnamed protein product [Rotaria sp. Silwood2]|nr:unnamed protein product [Rotaria sp. Silwood2]CAF4885148.1 unnamed protein product [Rotaria sp. Silwood2]
MLLESLANKIIIDLFEYLKPVYILQAFHNLNIRLNNLLFYYLRIHTFDFQSVSDIDFDNVCQQYLLSIVDQIISIRLPNNNNIPYEIDRFLAHDFSFQQFTRLQSLILDYNSCQHVQDKILFELHNISIELTHLTVI